MPMRLSFSALQRAENSSIIVPRVCGTTSSEFQCSSASRKFLNNNTAQALHLAPVRFSALQRAENSSIVATLGASKLIQTSFSALQRAENSSMLRNRVTRRVIVRFQCSSASRKFLNAAARASSAPRACVSVLFSEPKIPQCY